MRRVAMIGVLAALAFATPATAQGRGRGRGNAGVPGQRPAAGLCRIWIDGVPPGQQPAATDCATAAARVPANGRVIYGDRTGPIGQSVYIPGGRTPRVYTSNGQVVSPNGQIVRTNGQRCVQRADRSGAVRTVCEDGDNDRDARSVSRAYDQKLKVKHAKKPKHAKQHKGDYDRRDRD